MRCKWVGASTCRWPWNIKIGRNWIKRGVFIDRLWSARDRFSDAVSCWLLRIGATDATSRWFKPFFNNLTSELKAKNMIAREKIGRERIRGSSERVFLCHGPRWFLSFFLSFASDSSWTRFISSFRWPSPRSAAKQQPAEIFPFHIEPRSRSIFSDSPHIISVLNGVKFSMRFNHLMGRRERIFLVCNEGGFHEVDVFGSELGCNGWYFAWSGGARKWYCAWSRGCKGAPTVFVSVPFSFQTSLRFYLKRPSQFTPNFVN